MFPKSRQWGRQPPSVDPYPRILLVCEGRVTEPNYFHNFRREQEINLLEIEIDARGGVPKTLVERAAARKRQAEKDARGDRTLRYDQVWCIFDVDDHPKLKDAQQQARDNDIRIAISNPCFELWVLLHFQPQTAHIERSDLKRLCTHAMKGKEIMYDKVRPKYESAVKRATQLARRQVGNGCDGANPCTGVHELTETLRQLGRGERLRKLARGGR